MKEQLNFILSQRQERVEEAIRRRLEGNAVRCAKVKLGAYGRILLVLSLYHSLVKMVRRRRRESKGKGHDDWIGAAEGSGAGLCCCPSCNKSQCVAGEGFRMSSKFLNMLVLAAMFIVLLGGVKAVRFKVPGSVCGRVPNTFLCDDVPIGYGDPPRAHDNGTGRTPSRCNPGEYCPYGDVVYSFGRNQYAQLGLGDYGTRLSPAPMATIYAKVDRLTTTAHGNLLRWERMDKLFAWGRNDRGQLGLGTYLNDSLPNQMISINEPVLIEPGFQHTLVSLPPLTADFFEYSELSAASENGEFQHYGDSSTPIAPTELCPRCMPWEDAYQPANVNLKYTGRLCYQPTWGLAFGVRTPNPWCFIGKGGEPPCAAAFAVNHTHNGVQTTWYYAQCGNTGVFKLTPDPPHRLTAGACWRKQKVQVYQAFKTGVFFSISKSDEREGGGDGLVVVIQNNGIAEADRPIGGWGSNMGIARSTRYGFNDGIPNSIGIQVRTQGVPAIEVRACRKGPFTIDNSGDNIDCRLGISTWKPDIRCNPLMPDTCCTDVQLGTINSCFTEDILDGEQHELIIIYAPYVLEVYLDDPRTPKIRFDLDIRDHISSYKCVGGPKDGQKCSCNGEFNCGGAVDTTTCGAGGTCQVDGTAWMGFTASTGDAYSVHTIHSWNFVNLGQDGGVVSFGQNDYGQLGLSDTIDRPIANMLTLLDGIIVASASAGAQHSVIVSSSGVVYSWGGNLFGQLGQGDTTQRSIPTKVRVLDSLSTSAKIGSACVCGPYADTPGCQARPNVEPCTFKVIGVTAGAYHTIVTVERDRGAHELWGWGDNQFGQLGCMVINGAVQCPWQLTAVGTLGNWHRKAWRDAPCLGNNVRCMALPRRLAMFDYQGLGAMIMKVAKVQAGAYHNVLITADCPTCPMPPKCVSDEIAREDCICDGGARQRSKSPRSWVIETIECVAKGGELYTWGSNVRGQLGNNCTNFAHQNWVKLNPSDNECPDSSSVIHLNSPKPIQLLPYYPDIFPFSASGVPLRIPVDIAAGHYHTLVLMSDGTLLGWGSNYFGQLGLGDRGFRVKPTVVEFFEPRVSVAPNVGPFDGIGRSITEPPPAAYRNRRVIRGISAGEHHSVVVTKCQGGGFKPDGSCDCMFGWKGPDCDIECNGGANFSCSLRGTFDRANSRGDRTTCAAYLRNLESLADAAAAEDENAPRLYTNGDPPTCVGLKGLGFASERKGCPGSVSDDCPTACQFCDEEL